MLVWYSLLPYCKFGMIRFLNSNTNILSYREKTSGYPPNKIFFWELLGLSSLMALNWEALRSVVN
jgi:hypothetical protein